MEASSQVAPEESTPSLKKQSMLWRWIKWVLITLCVFIALISISNMIWMNTGDGEWKLEIDREGTKIYSLKAPGSSVKQFKGTTTHRNITLSHIIAPLVEEIVTENCSDWVPNCLNYEILKPFDETTLSNTTMWTLSLFPPFSPREVLLQGQIEQDPMTKAIFLQNIAVPNTISRNECCVRVVHFHNTFLYQPLPNGDVHVTFQQDLDMGGLFPALLYNLGSAEELWKMLHVDFPTLYESGRYSEFKDKHYDFIEEL